MAELNPDLTDEQVAEMMWEVTCKMIGPAAISWAECGQKPKEIRTRAAHVIREMLADFDRPAPNVNACDLTELGLPTYTLVRKGHGRETNKLYEMHRAGGHGMYAIWSESAGENGAHRVSPYKTYTSTLTNFLSRTQG